MTAANIIVKSINQLYLTVHKAGENFSHWQSRLAILLLTPAWQPVCLHLCRGLFSLSLTAMYRLTVTVAFLDSCVHTILFLRVHGLGEFEGEIIRQNLSPLIMVGLVELR